MWAMLAHLSGIIFYFIGPLVIWLIQKETMPFVNDQAKEALNWQITPAIGLVAASILFVVGIGVILSPGSRSRTISTPGATALTQSRGSFGWCSASGLGRSSE